MGLLMMKYKAISLTVLTLILITSAPSEAIKNFLGAKEFSAKTDSGIQFKIRITVDHPQKCLTERQGWRWGTENRPKVIIKKFEAFWGNQKIFIPLSAYIDLANLNEAVLSKTDDKFRFVLRGGDAATAYEAILIFEKGLLRSRKVNNGEFPDEAWEETIFSFNDNSM